MSLQWLKRLFCRHKFGFPTLIESEYETGGIVCGERTTWVRTEAKQTCPKCGKVAKVLVGSPRYIGWQ